MPQYEMIAGHYLHYLWLCIGKLIAIALHQERMMTSLLLQQFRNINDIIMHSWLHTGT